LAAGPIWSATNGESAPAKSTWPAMNCSRPAPDPVGLYDTLLPGQYWPHTWLNNVIAFCWAVEPSAVSPLLPPHPAVPAGPETAVAEAPWWLLSLPQPVSVPLPIAIANATAASALPFPSSLTDLAF
jgi:hypothetical protein